MKSTLKDILMKTVIGVGLASSVWGHVNMLHYRSKIGPLNAKPTIESKEYAEKGLQRGVLPFYLGAYTVIAGILAKNVYDERRIKNLFYK